MPDKDKIIYYDYWNTPLEILITDYQVLNLENMINRVFSIIFIVYIVIISLIYLNLGVLPGKILFSDSFILLNGGYRIFSGQRPHVDYISPIGIFPQIIVSISMAFFGIKVAALSHMQIVVALLSCLLAVLVSKNRLPKPAGLLFALMVFINLSATFHPASQLHQTSYAEIYNRQGVALVAISLLFLIPLNHSGVNKSTLFGHGIAISSIFFILSGIKPNFVVAITPVLALWFFRESSRISRTGFLTGTLLALVIAGYYTGFHYLNILKDYYDAGIVFLHNQPAVSLKSRFSKFILDPLLISPVRFNSDLTLLLILLLSISLYREMKKNSKNGLVLSQNQSDQNSSIRLFFCTLTTLFASLMSSKGITLKIPTSLIHAAGLFQMAMIMGPSISRSMQLPFKRPTRFFAIPCIVSIIITSNVIALMLARDAISPTLSYNQSRSSSIQNLRKMDSVHLNDFICNDVNISMLFLDDIHRDKLAEMPNYVDFINDGISLIKKQETNGQGVFSATYINPFNILMNLNPPRGELLWHHKKRTFDQNSRIDFQSILDNSSLVIVPRPLTENDILPYYNSLTEYQIFISPMDLDLYLDVKPVIDKDYIKKAESKYWTIYKKK